MQDAVPPVAADTARGSGRDPAASAPAVARGAAEETIRHSGASVRTDRPGPEDDWPLHHLVAGIATEPTSVLDRR